MNPTLIFLLVFTNFLAMAPTISTADEIKLQEQVVKAWKRLDKATSITSAVISVQRGEKEPKVKKFAVQGNLQKLELNSRVYLRTDAQTYVLRKKSDGGWVIERLSDEVDPNLVELSFNRKMGFSFYETCLLDAIASTDYQFSGWRELNNGNIEFVVKRLSDPASPPQSRPPTFTSMTVRVDPSANCRAVEIAAVSPTDQQGRTANISCKFDYATDPYCPSTVTRISEVSDGKVVRWVWSFTEINHRPLPAAEFSLPHYGIQEVFPKRWQLGKVTAILGSIILGVSVCYFSIRYIRS
jgi:hypothetical protein